MLAGEPFRASDNDYDWLGPGIYFWESNPERALNWAKRRLKNPDGGFVVGAVIELGFCLDLTTQSATAALLQSFHRLEAAAKLARAPMPRNSDDQDQLRRYLDCAVIRTLHQTLADEGAHALDTVKGVFVEGDPIYPGAAIRDLTHSQIAVVNPACIKGVFRVQGIEGSPV